MILTPVSTNRSWSDSSPDDILSVILDAVESGVKEKEESSLLSLSLHLHAETPT